VRHRVARCQRLAQLAASSEYSLDFRVSMDGYDAESNDPIRGDGREPLLRLRMCIHRALLFGPLLPAPFGRRRESLSAAFGRSADPLSGHASLRDGTTALCDVPGRQLPPRFGGVSVGADSQAMWTTAGCGCGGDREARSRLRM
jgi:hypothetical protein